jgi:hypothetical protein
LLKASEAKLDVPATRANASTYYPLACAIAGANFDLAADIDGLMRPHPGKGDDDELFAFTSLLRSLVRAEAKGIASARERLVDVSGDSERFAAAAEVAKAIEGQDEKGFNAALTTYLSTMQTPTRDDLDEMDPGEDRVSIDGLAFLQLAKRAKLKTRIKHPLIPTPLQTPKPVLPRDGYPSWP